MYVTTIPGLKVIRNGKKEVLPLGAPVPEAAQLPTFRSLLSLGHLGFDDKFMPADQVKRAQTPVVEAPVVEAKAKPSRKKA